MNYFLFLIFLCIFKGSKSSALYDGKGVIEVSSQNISEAAYNQSHVTFFQFYNHWCGHCIRFSPVWIDFTAFVKDWPNIVKPIAINCAVEGGLELCQKYEIMGTPTLAIAPPYATEHTNVTFISGARDLGSLLKVSLRYVGLILAGNPPSVWPSTLLPQNSSTLREKFSNTGSHFVVLVTSPSDEWVALLIILTLRDVEVLWIRQSAWNANTELSSLVSCSTSCLILPSWDGHPVEAALSSFSVSQISKAISARFSFVQSASPDIQVNATHAPEEEAVRRSISSIQTVEEEGIIGIRPTNMTAEYIASKNMSVQAVHTHDLVCGVRYSLMHEAALRRFIQDEPLEALERYIHALAQFLPVDQYVTNFLWRVHGFVASRMNGSISANEWNSFMLTQMLPDAYFPLCTESWRGCAGSSSRYRGYPCSLWLTAHAVVWEASRSQDQGVVALEAFAGYIKYFFGCRYCSINFQKMAKDLSNITSSRQAILWLHAAHNSANKRLAGDSTEDPDYPKIQYPSVEMCPTCRKNDSEEAAWNDVRTLWYLRRKYDRSSLLFDTEGRDRPSYLTTRHPRFPLWRVQGRRKREIKHIIPRRVGETISRDDQSSSFFFSATFSTFDIVMCVSIQMLGILIIFLVVINFMTYENWLVFRWLRKTLFRRMH